MRCKTIKTSHQRRPIAVNHTKKTLACLILIPVLFLLHSRDTHTPPQVEFSADTLRLNLIDLARTGSKLIQVFGQVVYQCPSGDPQDPVTFTTRDSHLVSVCLCSLLLPRWLHFNYVNWWKPCGLCRAQGLCCGRARQNNMLMLCPRWRFGSGPKFYIYI